MRLSTSLSDVHPQRLWTTGLSRQEVTSKPFPSVVRKSPVELKPCRSGRIHPSSSIESKIGVLNPQRSNKRLIREAWPVKSLNDLKASAIGCSKGGSRSPG
jgi:hypothetical protein